ncbi:unnamed protein product [Ostreobium quekettii]|uniref:Uncharacterized protein n=1 Tax=Ostreobium quekettii TaxID=121088 RepID=A0A8S1J6P6_9CHLO|nr:unnamed protein product [Ostreobium quekettii]
MLKSKLQKDSQDHRSYQRSVNDAFGKAVEDSLKKKMDEQMLPFIQAYEHLKRENGMLRASNERYKEILRKQPGRWTDEVEVKQERLENVENDSYINLPAYLHGGKNPGQANGPEFEVNEAMANVNQQPGSAKAPGTRRSKRAKRSPPPSASGSLPNGNSFPAAVAPQNPQIKSENGVATGPVEPQPSVQGGVGSDGAARQVLTGAWSYAEAQQAAGFGATAAPPADIPAWGAGSAAAPDSPVQWGSRSGSSPRGRGEGGTPAFEWGPGSVASPEIDWSQAGRASLQTDE